MIVCCGVRAEELFDGVWGFGGGRGGADCGEQFEELSASAGGKGGCGMGDYVCVGASPVMSGKLEAEGEAVGKGWRGGVGDGGEAGGGGEAGEEGGGWESEVGSRTESGCVFGGSESAG